MPVQPDSFKSALSLWASGVSVICYKSQSKSGGITVSSFSSVSLDPPLILFCLAKSSQAKEAIEASKAFSVNILSNEQKQISADFASGSLDKEEVLNKLNPKTAATGSPILSGSLASLDCRLENMIDAGDHLIVIGHVEEAIAMEGQPLLYFNRNYRNLV
ncbi:MAG: flavin reductase family protein [Leptospira sp.]|nr:flavin reductase family protein [Leptospira sp.]